MFTALFFVTTMLDCVYMNTSQVSVNMCLKNVFLKSKYGGQSSNCKYMGTYKENQNFERVQTETPMNNLTPVQNINHTKIPTCMNFAM